MAEHATTDPVAALGRSVRELLAARADDDGFDDELVQWIAEARAVGDDGAVADALQALQEEAEQRGLLV